MTCPNDPTLVVQCIASFKLFSMSPVPAKHAMHSQQALHGYAMLRQAHPALNFDSKRSTVLAMWPKDSKAYDRNMRHRSYSTSIYSMSTILNIWTWLQIFQQNLCDYLLYSAFIKVACRFGSLRNIARTLLFVSSGFFLLLFIIFGVLPDLSPKSACGWT